MNTNLLLFSHDFKVDLNKRIKSHNVHLMDINAEVLDDIIHKNHKLISELVKSLFKGYDKLTLVTNYNPACHHEDFLDDDRSLAFVFPTNNLKDSYELNDFHTAVMCHLKFHSLLVESKMFLTKELVSSQLSKTTKNVESITNLIKDYDALFDKSKKILDGYREDIILKFGAKFKRNYTHEPSP